MTAAQTGAALATDRVDLINEYDGIARLACGVEQVADARGTHADVQLHEVRAGHGEEGNARLPGDRLGKQSLTGSGRAHQQDAVGDFGAQPCKLLGRLQVLDDLDQLRLFLVGAGNIAEGDAVLVVRQPDVRLAEAVHLAGRARAAHHGFHGAPVQENQNDDQKDAGQVGQPERDALRRLVLRTDQNAGGDLLLDKLAQILVEIIHACQLVGFPDSVRASVRALLEDAVAVLVCDRLPVFVQLVLVEQHGQVIFVVDFKFTHLFLLEVGDDLVVCDDFGLAGCAPVDHGDYADNDDDSQDIPDDDLQIILH